MIKAIKKIAYLTVTIVSFVFMFVSEELWISKSLFKFEESYVNGILNKVLFLLATAIASSIFVLAFERIKWFHTIKNKNHNIEIRYGDILKSKKGVVIINFDECFTTKLGTEPGDIKESSLCGRFLKEHPINDMKSVLKAANVFPEKRKSSYLKKECFKPGTVVRFDDKYLLMAFATLNEHGLAQFDSLDEYIKCLSELWKQIMIKHGDLNVCVPVLGSGRTKIKGREFSQQELVDIMIFSYKLSEFRLKKPHKLIIYCSRENEFSLNKIGESFISVN